MNRGVRHWVTVQLANSTEDRSIPPIYDIRPGDLTVVHSERLPAATELVRRVVGLPGEQVVVRAVWIDGRRFESLGVGRSPL